jgi:hypothetical protein
MINPSEIKRKKKRLEAIKAELKTEFFGIDDVIDKAVSSIESWYILPQALKSPIIINLWGLTGVGKTQLVRSLVKKLDMSTKFVEVQMDGYSTTNMYGKDSICSILQSSNIGENEPGILLLDEFQRYRTIDEQGKTMEVRRYQDVWMLLSDGKFSTDFSLYTDLERQMYQADYWKERESEDSDDVAEDTPAAATPKKELKPMKFALSYYEAQTYKRLLRLNEPVSEIMKWPMSKLEILCREALAKRENNEIDYSKLLIFIGGNLDEAFQIASDLENCDTDADIFYKFSKKITIIDIKSALKERFKPEQISRLGNNHIIYPSLNKNAYQRIIFNATQKYIDFVKGLGISLKLNKGVYEEIYGNSVYPTQGARPVFSSIHKIFSSAIPTLTLWAFERSIRTIEVRIDPKKRVLIGLNRSKNVRIEIPIDLDIRERKASNTIDFNTMVAVHEASHAIVRAVTSGYAPLEVSINLATYKGGYMIKDENFDSKKDYIDNICTLLAGTVGEEFFFGEINRSSGCTKDLAVATAQAGTYFRQLGFGEGVGHISSEHRSDIVITDFGNTNTNIENLLRQCRTNTRKIIETHANLVMDVVNSLMNNNTVTEEMFIGLAKRRGLTLKSQAADVTTPYYELLERYKNGVARGKSLN